MSSKSSTITNQLNQLKSQAKMARKSRKLKCVFIGDSAVGKTSLIVSYTTNGYPTDYVPTAFDTYSVLVTIDNKPCQLQLYDTAGQDDFDSIRPLCYSNTDIFLVAFSVVSPRSFHNVRRKWLPEIRRTFAENNQYKGSNHSTIPPFIMIGTQCDLRHDVKVLIELNATSGEEPISSDYAKNMARKLGAICYIECSALTQKNLKEVFDSAILAGLEYQRNQQRSKHNHHHHPKHSPIGHHSVNQGPRPSKPSSSHKPSTANSADHQLTGSPYSPRFHGSTTAKQPMEEYDDILSGNSRNYHQKQHHYLPISTATATSATTVKLAQISDAKLVGWRKSLTKLSAEEALKQEAAAEIAESNNSTNTENNNYDNDHDQEDNYDYYYDYNPYYNPIDSLITTNDGNSHNNQPLQLPHQQQQLFTPNLSTFSPLLPARRSMKIANDSTESKGSSNRHKSSNKSSKESGHKNESFTKLQMLNSATATAHHHHHHKSPKGSPLLTNRKIMENDSSHGLKPLKNSKSNYMADYQPLPMACPTQNLLNGNNPYALQTYSTPYGTTVAMIPAIIASPVIKHRVTNQVKPLPMTPNIPAAAPPIIHNCSVFHQLNTSAHKSKKCLPVLAMVAPSINDEKARQPQQQQPAAATVTINNHNCKHVKQPLQSQQPLQPQSQQNMKSSTTLRSSSFFFLPSKMTGRKMMNINHQDDSVEICKQKPRKKLSKSNSVTSNDDGSVVSTASFESSASCSSDCSSNELFHKSNLPPETHDSNSNPNKSMLDLFHRLMSTSVSELRNRKSMFRRLASTISSSSRSATSSTFTNSDDHHHHPHRKLKNEKNILKNLYYIDCIDDIDHHNNYDDYDYEEIDFDRSSSKNNQRSSSGGDNGSSSKTCCGLGSGGSGGSSSSSLWTCCFSPNF